MLCDDVKRVMYFFFDGALGATKEQDLRKHLHDCPDCHCREVIQRKLREFVRRRVAPVTAPERLRLRLNRALRALCTD